MTKIELVNLMADNSYRDGLIEEERQYILYLNKEELKELFGELEKEYKLFTYMNEDGTNIELKEGCTLCIVNAGTVTVHEGMEFKLFKKVPIIMVPNIR